MVDKQLLDILCCPETKQDVTLADETVIRQINDRITDGVLTNRGGSNVKEILEAGLIRADRKYVYPIREGIPIMLIDEAIPVL